MPKVNGKEFPYTREGIIASEQEKDKKSKENGGESEEGQVNDELDHYVGVAQSFIYSDGVSKSLMAMGNSLGKDSGGDDAEGLAEMISSAVIQVDEKSNNDVPEDLILPLTEQVVQMIAELVESKTRSPVPEAILKKASMLAIGKLMLHYGVEEDDIANALGDQDPSSLRKSAGFAKGIMQSSRQVRR
jgi:hypothetical protein